MAQPSAALIPEDERKDVFEYIVSEVFGYGPTSTLRRGFIQYAGDEDDISVYHLINISEDDLEGMEYPVTAAGQTTLTPIPRASKNTVLAFQHYFNHVRSTAGWSDANLVTVTEEDFEMFASQELQERY